MSSILSLYGEIFAQIPAYAQKSINDYVRLNKIKFSIRFSDTEVDRLQPKFTIALSFFKGSRRQIWVRPILKSASNIVKRAVIQHEIAHCFVQPFCNHMLGHTKLPEQEGQIIEMFMTECKKSMNRNGLPITEGDGFEEDMVRFINLAWGGDELAASEFLLGIDH